MSSALQLDEGPDSVKDWINIGNAKVAGMATYLNLSDNTISLLSRSKLAMLL
jgi:hypothetical protein